MENKTQKKDLGPTRQGPFNFGTTPLVEVERTFRASPEAVFKAWTTPALAKQWWGPEGFMCPEAKIDARVGGKNLLAMKDPQGKVVWGGGTYLELIPNEKIVVTDQFMDKDGHILNAKDVGMPGDWPDTMKVTVFFEDIGDGRTHMKLVHEGLPADQHDGCVEGWSSSFNKLQRLVEKQS